MSYSYVKATTLSPLYLNDFYQGRPGLEDQGYDEQYRALMDDCHMWADHITRHLRELGADTHEIVYNADPLQQAWAREHGTRAEGKRLFIEQLNLLKPEVLFLHTSYPMYADLVPLVREQVPSVRLIQGWVCVGFSREHHRLFRSVDSMITCERGIHEDLTAAGARSHHIVHGFEHTLADRFPADSPDTDFFFAGNMVLSGGYHLNRADILAGLIDMGVDITIHSRLVGEDNNLPESLKQTIRQPIYGLEMLQALARARIAFNVHIDMTRSAANFRLFQSTGVGACLLTDRQPGLEDLFDVDREVVAYSSPEECAEKVRWLLDNPGERRAIAAAGQRRTLRDHRLADRVGQLHETILQELDRVSGRRS